MNSINKKNILIIIAVLMVGLLITGGTYAYLTVAMTVTNGNYATNTHCFGVTYSDDTDNISGTLFPTGNASGGLSGGISATADATCGLNGRGTLYLHIDNSTSDQLLSTVSGHCEVENTLETLQDYDSSAECTAVSGAKWVTNGTALKYAVFSGSDLYSSGYITANDKGTDKVIHEDFSVTTTTKTFDVYVWLDGYLSDDTYLDLPFNGSTKMVVMQTKSTDTTFTGDTPLVLGYLDQIKYSQMDFFYQRVEYIKSTGTQYILTDIYPTNTNGAYARIASNNTDSDLVYLGAKGSGDRRFWIGNNTGKLYFGWNTTTVYGSRPSITQNQVFTVSLNYLNNRKHIFNEDTIVASNIASLAVSSYSISIFGGNNAGTISYKSSIMLYELKISDNDKIIADFVPVYRKSDSKPGLYDAIGGKFYINQATSGDDFTVGADVS